MIVSRRLAATAVRFLLIRPLGPRHVSPLTDHLMDDPVFLVRKAVDIPDFTANWIEKPFPVVGTALVLVGH